MEARVQRFYDLGQFGRPYKFFNLVLLELETLAQMKNRRKAAYQGVLNLSTPELLVRAIILRYTSIIGPLCGPMYGVNLN